MRSLGIGRLDKLGWLRGEIGGIGAREQHPA